MVGAIVHAIETDALSGPVNVVAPEPPTNAEYTRVLGRVLGRPTFFACPRPRPASRSVEWRTICSASARVEPAQLQKTGYEYRYPELEGALRHLLEE